MPERLAPRLGIRGAVFRRWVALSSTSLLFGLEHLTLGPPWGDSLRQLVFVVSLGLLFGILVMVSTNLHFAGGVHAWINWLLLGATPVFVDIEPETWNISPAAIREAITPKTKAIMLVHTFGQPADMGSIGAIAQEHGLAPDRRSVRFP